MNIVLGRLAGPDASPRGDQVDAVHAVLQPASRVLVVQATGWGKSAVYWAATHALRHSGAGPTLVVSPLLALMRDQVSAAERAGLSAATVNSTNFDEWDEVFRQLDNDTLDVLLVSPERLGNARFAARLGELLARVGLIVIDEAHCISDWGFDFRPDYQRLARALLSTPTASVLATTATANERVTKDVSDQLGVDTVTYRGMMFTGVPNLAWVFGYFRASWTLRVDIMGDFITRLFKHMEQKGVQSVTPQLRPEDADMTIGPWMDPNNFNPNYLMRSQHLMPKSGDKQEWKHDQNYSLEKNVLPVVDLDDGCLIYK